MISPARRLLVENNPLYCPFGKPRVHNILENFNNRLHDQDNDKTTTTVLFLESGDLRNALTVKTDYGQKQGNLHIHLNDCDASIVARNVMMLSIISSPEFNPEDENDFTFLWDVWYNSKWPETTRNKFKMILKDLLDGKLPENIVIGKSKHLNILREIWSSWQATSSKSPANSKLLMKKIDKERSAFIFQGWKEARADDRLSSFSKVLDDITNELVNTIGSHEVLCKSPLKQKIYAEARTFLEIGHCRLQKEKTVCVNPTLLHPTTLHWYVHYVLSPYAGYFPLDREELDVTVENQILIRSCQSVLESLLLSYRQRMKDVKVFFYTEDALEFCYTERSKKFDVIDCADLADVVGLVNLINACKLCLADHEDAQILTKTVIWGYLTPMLYIEEMLCCPSSMIPTIYGLRLASYFQAEKPDLFQGETSDIDLCWKNAAVLRNVIQYSSPTLTNCLIQLANKCFLLQDNSPLAQYCTPWTFHNVTNSAALRITDGSWINEAATQIFGSELPSMFRLSKEIITRWTFGVPVLKLTADLEFKNESGCCISTDGLFDSPFGDTPALRLALIPHLDFCVDRIYNIIDLMTSAALLNSNVHYIDNVKFEMTKAADDSIKSATLSFLLIPGLGLEKSHAAVVFDLAKRQPIFFIGKMDKFRVEKYQVPYPYERKKSSSSPSLSTSKDSEMLVANSCVETEDDYTIKVNLLSRSKKPISGINVSTDQRLPCKLAHELTVSISQPQNIKPLKISLPYPFIASSVQNTIHRQDRLVVLVLQKAKGSEPWPCDIHRDGKRMNEASENGERQEGNRCSACGKTSTNLKRCGKCRAISYCTVECQRANWPQHKLMCPLLGKN